MWKPATTKPLPVISVKAPAATKQIHATTMWKPSTTKLLPAINMQAPAATKQVSTATTWAPVATKQIVTNDKLLLTMLIEKPSTTGFLPQYPAGRPQIFGLNPEQDLTLENILRLDELRNTCIKIPHAKGSC
ncbi:hypothetical protein DSO57_1027916 [Entomophthora muscae]|uniref:Uncharacterized protein n=1 Tax=Entomophthora muscae TaxID=34485 RepID=A0ACC2S3Q2_9FUNG|nr:hypothetical protein DSO57_1027916 [Entomophthora muscae]